MSSAANKPPVHSNLLFPPSCERTTWSHLFDEEPEKHTPARLLFPVSVRAATMARGLVLSLALIQLKRSPLFFFRLQPFDRTT